MLGDHLLLLLRSVLSKMQSVKTASVMQSLLMVYAYLLKTEVHGKYHFPSVLPFHSVARSSSVLPVPGSRSPWTACSELCTQGMDITARESAGHMTSFFGHVLHIILIPQPFFYGVFETRLSTMALCQLLTHCVTTGDQVLCSLTIEEEEVATGDGVVTRSQRAAGNTGSVASPFLYLPLSVQLLCRGQTSLYQ